MTTFHILTLFPEMFAGPFDHSMVLKARKKRIVAVKLYALRRWGIGPRRQVDDSPYGGGGGMILRPEPVHKAVAAISKKFKNRKRAAVILLTPQGKRFDQKRALKLAKNYDDILLIAGHYGGFDERIRKLADLELSIGDYVLTGGEIPAMVVVDAVARLLPGVLKEESHVTSESFLFENGLLEYPHYTRPAVFQGRRVPAVLLSGDHKKIAAWRKDEAAKRTKRRRPDLLR